MFKIKKVKPKFTGVVTTAYKYVTDGTTEAGLIKVTKRKGELNFYQRVIAVGDTVKGIKEGDIVRINFKRYAIAQHTPGKIDADQNKQYDKMQWTYQIPIIPIEGEEYLFLQDADIEYVVTEYEIDEGGLLE